MKIEKYKNIYVGNEFWMLTPSCFWFSLGSSLRVNLKVHYGHFKIKKVNRKTFKADCLKSIGCGYSGSFSMDTEDLFFDREEMKKRIIEVIPIHIKNLKNTLHKYTDLAPEFYFGNAKKDFYESLLLIAQNGLEEKELEKLNKRYEFVENKVEKRIKELEGK